MTSKADIDNQLKDKFSKFLSHRTQNRKLVTFWEGDDLINDENIIELTGGMPNEVFFPLNSMDLYITSHNNELIKTKIDHHMLPSKLPMCVSFQYNDTSGVKPLINIIEKLTEKVNKPVYNDWDIILANGSSDAMFKVFETICDSSTTVLLEEFTFTPVISNIETTGAKIFPIRMDFDYKDYSKQGINVEFLSNLLDNWEKIDEYKDFPKPTVLYTIPTGQNPTGMTLSNLKRKRIYKIAQKHGLIIVEDDPYSFFSFPKYNVNQENVNPFDSSLSNDNYIKNHIYDSFFSIDTDGRVIRLETFSKLYAPGLRLSYIIANRFFIKKILEYTEITTKAPSGVSQAILYSTIKAMSKTIDGDNENIDSMIDGWLKWIIHLASQYTQRRNITCKELYNTKAYQNGYFEIIEPSGGMFICLKINLKKLKGYDTSSIYKELDILDEILTKNGVKVVLGYKMAISNDFSMDYCDLLRITFAYAKNDDELVEASKRIGRGIEEYFLRNST